MCPGLSDGPGAAMRANVIAGAEDPDRVVAGPSRVATRGPEAEHRCHECRTAEHSEPSGAWCTRCRGAPGLVASNAVNVGRVKARWSAERVSHGSR